MPTWDYTFQWGWIFRSSDEVIHLESFEILGQMLITDDAGQTKIAFYGTGSDGVLLNSASFDAWYKDKPIFATVIGVFKPGDGPSLSAIDRAEKELLSRIRNVYIV
jgi:hypothetical protein